MVVLLTLVAFTVMAGVVVVAVCALSSRNRQGVEWEQPLPDSGRLEVALPQEDALHAIR